MVGISDKDARYLKRMEKLLGMKAGTSDFDTKKSEVSLSTEDKKEADLKKRSTLKDGFINTMIDDLKVKNVVWNRLDE